MDAKIRFGVDYLNIMYASLKSGEGISGRAYTLLRLLLFWDWGFTFEEFEEASNTLIDRQDKGIIEDFSTVAKRIITHLITNEEAKTKFVVNMIMADLVDYETSPEESKLALYFAAEFDFRKSDIAKMGGRAADMVDALAFYVEYFDKKNTDE